jgi:hypothetical protein
MEPTTTAGGILGVKYATLVAGFFGGVASLSYVRELTRSQMAVAVFTGAVTAGYMTPLANKYLGLFIATGPELEGACAFLIGVTALNIIPGFIRLSAMFKKNPAGFLKNGGKDADPS